MEWIKVLVPLLGVVLGWILSERAKTNADKKQDKRKLNRLLFFVLELRYHFNSEFKAQSELERFLEKLKDQTTDEFGPEAALGVDLYKPFVKQTLEKNFGDETNIEFLEKNIDDVIVELSEVLPVFAYELNGQYDIRQRLENANKYLDDSGELLNQLPFDIQDWMMPKITEKLLSEIDETLELIAKKINHRTWVKVKKKINKMDEPDDSDFDEFVNDYFNKVRQEMS